jgi:small subunit ribosomal protein S6
MLTIFSPHLNDEDLNARIEEVQGYITARGGEIASATKDSPWGRRRLAYTIRHNGQDLRDGFYVLFYYDLDANQVADMERLLRLNEGVVRYMVVKVDEKKAAKQAEAAAKHAAYVAAEESKRPGGGRPDRPERPDRDRY